MKTRTQVLKYYIAGQDGRESDDWWETKEAAETVRLTYPDFFRRGLYVACVWETIPEPEKTWSQKMSELRLSLGRTPTLNEMVELSKTHVMTVEEVKAQRDSWAKQMMD